MEYAEAKGIAVIGEYVDEAISGKEAKTASRAAYQRMLRDGEKRAFDTILIHKYNRIARSLAEHVLLEKRLNDWGIALIAVAEDFGDHKAAKIMRTLMWSMSEYYIDDLSEEVKKGHRENALRGIHNGGYAPFGYDVVNQAYIVNELEAEYVRRMFAAVVDHAGYADLIQEMGERGIVGKRGRPIRYPQIYEILRNEKYAGVYVYSQTMSSTREGRRQKADAEVVRIENALPAIIDRDLFEEVQRIMTSRQQAGHRHHYLCRGLVYCGCGAKMHGMTSHRKGHTYSRYYCSAKCGAATVRTEIVDNVAKEYLVRLLSQEEQAKITEAIKNFKSEEVNAEKVFAEVVKKRISEKARQVDNLVKNLATGMLPPEAVSEVGKEIERLKGEIENLRNTPPPKEFSADTITSWLESIKNASDEKAIRLLIERIDVKNATDISCISTLTSVAGNLGRGDRI